jgi:regulator of protease activity HflC (stomatin/prohibitin superfamily)
MTAQPQPRRIFRPARSRSSIPTPTVNWAWLVLAVIFIGYWLFVASLERIEGNIVLASILRRDLTPAQAAAISFPLWLTWLAEMVHPRVLRHFIPIIVGWWLAVQAAISLMQVLYDCSDRRTAAEFLRRQRRNQAGGQETPYTVSPKNLADMRGESILLRVGGPVWVNIPDGHAAVTERNARFLRVLPPGVHTLGRFEYLLGVVDLRPQERSATGVTMLTREGIPLQADVELTFRIDPGDDPVTHRRPFPFREEAVRKAAYAGAVGANGEPSTWVDAPLGKVRGALSAMVSEESLDNLIAAESPRDVHHLLTEAVTRKVWDSLPKDGIKPIRLHISRLTPPPEVSRQYTDFWLSNQYKADALARANGTIELVQEVQTAQAAADVAMLQAIIEGIRLAQQEAGTKISSVQLTVQLLKALRRMFQQSTQSLQRVGGDTAQLMAEIESATGGLSGLQDRLLPPPPAERFNPSKPD